MPDQSTPSKRCTKCGIDKPLTEFSKHPQMKSGLQPACKACHSAARKARRANPEKVEQDRQSNRLWREANRERRAVYMYEYSQKRRAIERAEREREWQAYLERGIKRCFRCQLEKPFSDFRPHKTGRDRLDYVCRKCSSDMSRERAAANRERARASSRATYHRYREYRRKQNSEWGRNNRELRNAMSRRWRQANPDKARAIHYRRVARLRGNGGSFSPDEWSALCEFYGNRCVCCGSDAPMTVDHVIPVSAGGTSDISNIQPLCKSCNSRKGASAIDYRPFPFTNQRQLRLFEE